MQVRSVSALKRTLTRQFLNATLDRIPRSSETAVLVEAQGSPLYFGNPDAPVNGYHVLSFFVTLANRNHRRCRRDNERPVRNAARNARLTHRVGNDRGIRG